MDVSRDDEVSPPPAVPMAYYMPSMPTYAAMYFPSDPAGASQYGYHVSQSMSGMPMLYAADHTDIMSIIPTLRCWSCGKCGNLNYAHRLTCNLRKCQKMSSELADTDWMCACGNVNYRFRKYCNLRKCQLPQIGNPYLFYGVSQLIKNGYSSQAALSLLLTNGGSAPFDQDPVASESTREGCWQCTDCGNLNWPWRDSCNRKGCTTLRTSTSTL